MEAGEWKRAIDVNNIADGLTAIPVTLNSTQSFSVPAGGYQVYVKGEPAVNWRVGDVNLDSEVTIADVTALISIILNGTNDSAEYRRADINNDNELTIADVTALISIILNN